MAVPLEGSGGWQRATARQASLDQITSISVSLDSWGGDSFTVWLDGLAVE
jgi:hypothetical protein